MKKYFVMALAVLFMVIVAHSVLAVEVEHGLLKGLYVNNEKLLVSLIECEIEKIDQKREFIEFLLSVSVDLQEVYISTEAVLRNGNSGVPDYAVSSDINSHENSISKFKKAIQKLHELKKKKLEELKEAKQYLKEAKSMPE